MAERVIGIDLGGTKALLAVLEGGRILAEQLVSVHELKQEELLELIEQEVRELRSAHPEVSALGIGIPSLIDEQQALAVSSVNLPINDFPIRQHFQDRFNLGVAVENDANCAAIAEAKMGAGRGARVTVCLTVGTGVGSGVVVDGTIVRGARGYATELGHMVIDKDGPPCSGKNCPNHGCLESLASGNALERMSGGRSGQEVVEAARAGDEEMARVFEELARNLGIGIASAINIFNPDVVAVGGGLSAAGDLLLGPATDEARKRALPAAYEVAEIVIAKLGQKAGVVGAGLVAERLESD